MNVDLPGETLEGSVVGGMPAALVDNRVSQDAEEPGRRGLAIAQLPAALDSLGVGVLQQFFGQSLPALTPGSLRYDKPLCASQDGFTLHAATRAGALDAPGREALCKYVLRPVIAQERITHGPQGLVRIALKKPFADGTVAVDMDPLSLLCRLAASVPPPRLHTVRYAGVLAPASKLRSRVVPQPPVAPPARDAEPCDEAPARSGSRYRPWAELMKRTFSLDVLQCPSCGGRLRLVALVTDPKSTRRLLRGLGEPTEAPARQPARGPPYWKSRVLRRGAGDDEAVA